MKVEALYKITSKSDNSASLQIFGEIGNAGFTLKDFRAAVGGLEVSKLDIDLNSRGGDPFEAFAIHDAIRGLNARVTVNIVGMAASAATIIAAAADRITITENGQYLIHESSTLAAGKKGELEAAAELLEKIDNQMLAIYVKRTGKQAAELTALMAKDNLISAAEALEWGFVDEIINVEPKKISAMTKVTAEVTPEEVEKLQEEIEELKKELVEARAKLKAYEDEDEEKKEAEVNAELARGKDAGIITDATLANWHKQLKSDISLGRAQINAILEAHKVGLPTLPKPQANAAAATAETKEGIWTEFKEGKITLNQCNEKLSKIN